MNPTEAIKEELLGRQKLRSMPYRDFLASRFWQEVRKMALKRAAHRCQLCNSPERLHVHHRTYENRGWEDQHLEDLTVLCEQCHKKHHTDFDVVANPKLADKVFQQERGWQQPHFDGGDVTLCRPMTPNELKLFRAYRARQGIKTSEPYELSPAFHSYWDSVEQRRSRQGVKSAEELEYGI